ncbi:hypothetical protein LTR28_007467 [Elasticomyces elasticus]|nr:hypothetical protein LTR28_007467 [Elasticomyces elasticus]
MAACTPRALTKRNAETALMPPPPPPPPKRIKRPTQALDEETYASAISHIVARDFFPGVLEARAQQEYLDALDSHDGAWIREAGRRVRVLMTPGRESGGAGRGKGTRFGMDGRMGSETPGGRLGGEAPNRNLGSETPRTWAGDTPASVAPSVAESKRVHAQPVVDTDMSLAEFMARYTSEDNESFYELVDKQNIKRAAKYAFLHNGNQIPSTRQIAHRNRQQKLLMVSGEDKALTAPQYTPVAEAENAPQNAIVARPSQDLDDRPASVKSFPNRQGARNTFMFAPSSIEDTHQTIAQRAQERSNAPPKAVAYNNTRMNHTSAENESSVPPTPTLSAIDDAIAGRPRPSDSEPGYSGAETPRVNGYAYVDEEPTPSELGLPAEDEDEDPASLFALMGADAAPNPFKLQSASKRESLHHRLVDRQNKLNAEKRSGTKSRLDQLRALGVTPGRTPTPKFGSAPARGTVGLTPAAQKLFDSMGTPRCKEEMGWFGDRSTAEAKARERQRWTPTPAIGKAVLPQ